MAYKQVISEYNMVHILRIFEIFASEWQDLKLTRSRYFVQENEIHIHLESGTKIMLALQDDITQ